MKSDVAPPKTFVNDLHVRNEKYVFLNGLSVLEEFCSLSIFDFTTSKVG